MGFFSEQSIDQVSTQTKQQKNLSEEMLQQLLAIMQQGAPVPQSRVAGPTGAQDNECGVSAWEFDRLPSIEQETLDCKNLRRGGPL